MAQTKRILPHYVNTVCDFLSVTFPDQWIGCCGPVEWHLQSQDLTPIDILLWGHLRCVIYTD
jgi:hypothetical protein